MNKKVTLFNLCSTNIIKNQINVYQLESIVFIILAYFYLIHMNINIFSVISLHIQHYTKNPF